MDNATNAMTRFALFLGTDQFPEDHHIPELQCARKDAGCLHALFQGPMGYGDRAELLLQPSASQVWAALRRLGQRVRSGDTFTMYIAGHGVQHGADQYVLLPGAVLRRLRAGTQGQDVLSMQGVVDEVLQWPDVQCLLMLDVCRRPLVPGDGPGAMPSFEAQVQAVLTGLASRDPLLRRAAGPATTQTDGGGPRRHPGRVTIINACSDGERAYEVEPLERGLFSLAVEARLDSALRRGAHWMVTPESAGELAVEMAAVAARHGLPVQQRPWVSPVHAPVVVFKPGLSTAGLEERSPTQAPRTLNAPKTVEAGQERVLRTGSTESTGATGLEADWKRLLQSGRVDEALPKLRQCVDKGDADAMSQMAVFLHYGSQPSVEKDTSEAERLWRAAIAAGDASAMHSFSQVLRSGDATPQKVAEARRLLIQAAALGNSSACIDACLDWLREPQDRLATRQQLQGWLDSAAQQMKRNDPGWLHLAVFALHGPEDWHSPRLIEIFLDIWAGASPPEPRPWDKASDRGTWRELTLAFAAHVLLDRTDDGAPPAHARARAICDELRLQSGGRQPDAALTHFAISAGHGVNRFEKDSALCRQLLHEAALVGGAQAQFELYQWHRYGGQMHLPDADDAQTDDELATQYLRNAAGLGHPDALVALATAHASGHLGLEKDFSKARNLTEQALAHELTPDLLSQLGKLLREGDGALADADLEASIWYRCLHHPAGLKIYHAPEAMLSFALQLWFGKGVRQDRREATRWLEASVEAVKGHDWVAGANVGRYMAAHEYQIGAALAGGTEYGFMHHHGRDPEAARPWFERAADHGDEKARKLFICSYASEPPWNWGRPDHDYGLRWPIDRADAQVIALFRAGDMGAARALQWRLEQGGKLDAALVAELFEALYAEAKDDERLRIAEAAYAYYSKATPSADELQVRADWSRLVGREKSAQLARKHEADAAESAMGAFDRAVSAARQSSDREDKHAKRAFELMQRATQEKDATTEVLVEAAFWTLTGFGTDANPLLAIEMLDQCLSRAQAANALDEAAETIAARLLNQEGDLDESAEFNRESLARLVVRLASSGSFSGIAALGMLQAEAIGGLPRDEAQAGAAFDALFRIDAARAVALLKAFLDSSRVGWRQAILLPHRRFTSHLQRVAAEALYRHGGDPVKGEAASCLAEMYGDGLVVAYPKPGYIQQSKPESDLEDQWRVRAAEAGHAWSVKRVAASWLKSPQTEGHVQGAWRLLHRSATQGDIECRVLLGDLLLDHPTAGEDVSPAESRPEYWLDTAVGQSEQWSLSIAQAVFRVNDPARVGLSMRWLRRALDKSPSPSAWFLLAARHAHGQGLPASLKDADDCLERGVALATSEFARQDLTQRAAEFWMDGTLPKDPVRAVSWLRRAAELKSTPALWQLGMAYASGYAGLPDRKQAEHYFRRSIADGNRYEGMEGLTYWWARWGATENATEALEFINEWKCDDDDSETDALMTLLRRRLRFMLEPPPVEHHGFPGWAGRLTASRDYRLPIEQALCAMEPPLLPERLDRARFLLKDALELLRNKPDSWPISIDRETAYIQTLQARLSTLKPSPWIVRLIKGQL